MLSKRIYIYLFCLFVVAMVTTCLHIRSTPIIKITEVKVTEVMGLVIRSHSKGLWVIRSMSAKLGHRDILIRSHIYIYVRSRSQNNYVKVAKLPQYVWCQDSPKIRGHRGQGQMMAAILDLLRQTHIYY